jgi:hypothetical protein
VSPMLSMCFRLLSSARGTDNVRTTAAASMRQVGGLLKTSTLAFPSSSLHLLFLLLKLLLRLPLLLLVLLVHRR